MMQEERNQPDRQSQKEGSTHRCTLPRGGKGQPRLLSDREEALGDAPAGMVPSSTDTRWQDCNVEAGEALAERRDLE